MSFEMMEKIMRESMGNGEPWRDNLGSTSK